MGYEDEWRQAIHDIIEAWKHSDEGRAYFEDIVDDAFTDGYKAGYHDGRENADGVTYKVTDLLDK